MPSFVREYVILHELTHLEHLNHSNQFWDRLAKLCPNHRAAESWLKNTATESGKPFRIHSAKQKTPGCFHPGVLLILGAIFIPSHEPSGRMPAFHSSVLRGDRDPPYSEGAPIRHPYSRCYAQALSPVNLAKQHTGHFHAGISG